jgi:hypothetical protein
MREFRKAESEEFFAVCDAIPAAAAPPAGAASEPPQALPFQCQPPQRQLSWRDFLPASH